MDFITDRTEADVLLGNAKGVYSHIDLNRVENAVAAIGEELSVNLGFSVFLTAKTDWEPTGDFLKESWPTASQMERYLSNVRCISNIFPSSVMLPTSMSDLTWRSANNIERALHYAAECIAAVKSSFQYSGEVYAGEEI